MKILILTDYFPPEIGGASHLVFELSQSLVKRGHRVSVATQIPRYNLQEVPQKYKGRRQFYEEIDGIQVTRLTFFPAYGAMTLVRGLSHLFSAASLFVGGVCSGEQDVILALSPPLPLGVTAYMLGKLRSALFIINVQDIFPQNAIDLGLLKNPLVIWFLRQMEQFVYRKATYITVHSSGNREYLTSKREVPPEKVVVIPNWVDRNLIIPSDKQNAFRNEYNLNSKFVVLFAGVMGWSQGLDVVIESANLLRKRDDIIFLLVGEGVEKARLELQAERLGLANVCFLPMQPREKYPLVVNAADVCLVTLRKEVSTPVVPSKLLGIMASGRPVVASLPLDGDAPKIIKAARCGYCVPPGDPERLAEAILKLYQEPAIREEFGANGRPYAVEHFSLEACVDRYEKLFEDAMQVTVQ